MQQVEQALSEGHNAAAFLNEQVSPYLSNGIAVVFEFEGVRSMNSSFSNALFANMLIRHGEDVLEQISIDNARGNVKAEIESAYRFAKRSSADARSYCAESYAGYRSAIAAG